ncbi:MAG: hypothetical protein JWO15_3747, partial [Sphingomonadales bacterium]|nr:hypothetical protein [Sphingomonadales bacterium]
MTGFPRFLQGVRPVTAVEEYASWLQPCGSCDAALTLDCTCPSGDPRSVIAALAERADRVEEAYDELVEDASRELQAAVETGEQLMVERDLTAGFADSLRAECARLANWLDRVRLNRDALVGAVDRSDRECTRLREQLDTAMRLVECPEGLGDEPRLSDQRLTDELVDRIADAPQDGVSPTLHVGKHGWTRPGPAPSAEVQDLVDRIGGTFLKSRLRAAVFSQAPTVQDGDPEARLPAQEVYKRRVLQLRKAGLSYEAITLAEFGRCPRVTEHNAHPLSAASP